MPRVEGFGCERDAVGASIALCDGSRRIAFASVQEPVERYANIVLLGFPHDAGDGLARFVEDDGAGDDIAQTKV